MIFMGYDVFLHENAEKELSKLEKELQARVRKSLKKLKKYPKKYGDHLKNSKFWKLRVGDYRAIYEIKSNEKVIVLFVGHRKNVYDDFSKLF